MKRAQFNSKIKNQEEFQTLHGWLVVRRLLLVSPVENVTPKDMKTKFPAICQRPFLQNNSLWKKMSTKDFFRFSDCCINSRIFDWPYVGVQAGLYSKRQMPLGTIDPNGLGWHIYLWSVAGHRSDAIADSPDSSFCETEDCTKWILVLFYNCIYLVIMTFQRLTFFLKIAGIVQHRASVLLSKACGHGNSRHHWVDPVTSSSLFFPQRLLHKFCAGEKEDRLGCSVW